MSKKTKQKSRVLIGENNKENRINLCLTQENGEPLDIKITREQLHQIQQYKECEEEN
ncbi:MAG: hypothetical protein WBA93_17295 [Microcoleaceae cyanobacterium]